MEEIYRLNVAILMLSYVTFVLVGALFFRKKDDAQPTAIQGGKVDTALDVIFVWFGVPGSTPGSRTRNLFSYLIFVLCGLLILEVSVFQIDFLGATELFLTLLIAIIYFVNVTFTVLKIRNANFIVHGGRLVRDVVLSSVFCILSFALCYRIGLYLGYEGQKPTDPISAWDSLYFSAVTFSTLGYGDIRPFGLGRAVAAVQAIVGNAHLAFLVSAAFITVNQK